jgi:holin-like protein
MARREAKSAQTVAAALPSSRQANRAVRRGSATRILTVLRRRPRQERHPSPAVVAGRASEIRGMGLLHTVLVLIALQCAGDLIAAAASVPIPGMVIGLVLLLAGLGIRGRRLGPQRAVPHALARIAETLHGHFGLLFVPAGVGVLANIGRLAANGPALLAAVLCSTALTIAVTATIAAGRDPVSSRNTASAE